MSSSLKELTVLASFAVQPVTRETESERYFENHYKVKSIREMSGLSAASVPQQGLPRQAE